MKTTILAIALALAMPTLGAFAHDVGNQPPAKE